MSHPHSPEHDLSDRRAGESARSPFADVAGRFANWLAGVDRVGDEPAEPAEPGADPHDEVAPFTRAFRPLGGLGAAPAQESAPVRAMTGSATGMGSGAATAVADEPDFAPEPELGSQFPLAPLGYNRAAVDDHLARLERELAELRAVREPAMSITEELEWIGEQTSSILVVAHDKANETTRRAKEQADRTVAEAAAKALAITEDARRRLGELDAETDQVWRERERLLDDVRIVSAALAELADEATSRFPAADGGLAIATVPATVAFDAVDEMEAGGHEWDESDDGVGGPQATRPFSAAEAAEASGHETPAMSDQAEPASDSPDEGDRPDELQ